jgi:hypothetical protein
MNARSHDHHPPGVLMVWTLTDEVIENEEIRVNQFHEIRRSGFGGVAVYVRCSRYTWHDPPARAALRGIGRLCRRYGMACWLGPDPRFVSRQLIGTKGGVEVLLFGNRTRADRFPNFGTIHEGQFTVRCDLEPRHVHTLNEVAIEYYPRGIARVYAVLLRGDDQPPEKVLDITNRSCFFYNARARYVEAFGTLQELKDEGWRILAFFHAETSHVDYSNAQQMRRYMSMLDALKKEGCAADGIMWDEAGYTCTYGTLPFAPAILKEYRRRVGKDLSADLWKLALPAGNESHVRVRCAYYASVQRTLNAANAASTRHLLRLWGAGTVSGIHDTWHFESADMCDMNHGSLDLWEAMKTKTGGFVDLGGIDQLREPHSSWYSHIAAMNVICASLGKMSKGNYAYNNLWTVGDDGGEGWQSTIMSYCVDTMAIFGLRWLAHAYGPVGTIGEERSFLGSPPLPGYPAHSTWPHFPGWTARLNEHLGAVEDKLPESGVLVVFPIETLYSLAGPAADAASVEVFRLILALLDTHIQVDVHAPSICREGRWAKGVFHLGNSRYRAVIFPFAQVLSPELLPLLRTGGKNVFAMGGTPRRLSTGRTCASGPSAKGGTIASVLEWLATLPGTDALEAPKDSWATVTPLERGTMISVCPSRHGYTFSGPLRYRGAGVILPECTGLTRVFFPTAGTPEMVFPK